ncbi:MAG: ANTAR domain-containing protein [Gammaproteobacteria bacterium]|nr:ANTAR domain-containing protein [Gammaproteobacteria bacterium]
MAIKILQELRNLNTLIVHPDDRQRSELCKHVERIGCNVTMEWPFPKFITSQTDLIFVAMMQDHPLFEKPLLLHKGDTRPTIIAIVDYENPTVLQTAYDIGVHAIINAPFKPFGLLSNMVVARMHWQQEVSDFNKIQKLENKVRKIHCVEQAISILGRNNEVDRQKAYQFIRKQAMDRRISTEEFAQKIVQADKTLDITGDKN